MKQFVEKKASHIKDCDCSQCRISKLEFELEKERNFRQTRDQILKERLDTWDRRLAKWAKKMELE